MARGARLLKWTGLAMGTAALAAVIAGHAVFVALHRSLPAHEGVRQIAGIGARVDILRDRAGVPHIFASSREDAFFAQGYAHAQDRLWQMDFARRIGQGRLAEILGPPLVPLDRAARAIDLVGVSERNLAAMPARAQDALAAYAAGVNAYLVQSDRPRPPEYLLPWIEAEPWEPVHSVLLIKMLAAQLSSNAFSEIMRLSLLRETTPDVLMALMPGEPGPLPTPESLYGTALPEKKAALRALPLPGASNNWVVDGAWSASAKPLLANDPHLGFAIPSIWYLAHLAWDGHNVIGASMPGVPGIILGRNDHLAWGYTTTGADVQDLYLERLDPDNAGFHVTATGARPLTQRTETIKVLFGKPITETFYAGKNGPLLPPDLPVLADIVPKGHALALRWAALDARDDTVVAGLDILEARSGAAFVAAMEPYVAPMQSMVYADSEGAVGLLVPGHAPIRRSRAPVHGLLPVPAWTDDHDWVGAVPYSALPHWPNPDIGLIVTANNKIVSDGYPHVLGYEWDREARASHIEKRLLAERQHTVMSFAAIQLDAYSPEAQALLPGMLAALDAVPPRHALAGDVRRLLGDWDFRMAGDQSQPLVFAAWLRAFERQLLDDEPGSLRQAGFGWPFALLDAILAGAPAQRAFCDDRRTVESETCEALLSRAFDAALDDLVAEEGRKIAQWRWGRRHEARHVHQPFGRLPVIGRLFERRIETDGGADTVNRGLTRFDGRRPYANVHGATYRAVYDLAEPERSVFMISTGQSGHPFSPHYDDLMEPWARGEYLLMTTNRGLIEDEGAVRLRLEPLAASP